VNGKGFFSIFPKLAKTKTLMYKFLLLLLFPFASFAQTAQKEFKMKGELKLAKPIDWIYLRYHSGDDWVLDSTQTKDGSFKFDGKIAEPTVATLLVKFTKAAGEEKAGRDALQIFLEPTKINVIAKDSLKLNSVTGSAAHADFSLLKKQEESLTEKAHLQAMYDSYEDYRKKGDKEGMKKLENAIDDAEDGIREQVYGDYLKNHAQSPAALYALKQYAGYVLDPVKVEPYFNKLSPAVQQLPSAVSLKEQIDIAKKTAIGNTALDFSQNDTLGKAVSLSSFRGKYVLIDFWASWCGPCRRENPNVVRTFEKYKDKGFTVLGVSLDRPNAQEKWMKAIHDDGLAWTQVSDLQFWDNAVAKLYGIRSIPQNFLIDPQGKIVAKNLRGEELEAKLAGLLGK
jgi:peroxiredoxin